MKTTTTILPVLLLAAACGGKAPKSGLGGGGKGGGDVPPPPDVSGGGGGEKRETTFSKDARADFKAAADFFAKHEAEGWDKSSCGAAAEKFAGVARQHKIVEAQYMVGRSYHACNLAADAEAAYQAALKLDKQHAPSISNLGELYWNAGKRDGAKQYWETAVEADPKIVAARANLAMLMIEEMRTIREDDKWWKVEEAARDHLSSVLAVDNDHVRAYVLYGLLYLEQPPKKKNKNRYDLAKLLLDEGEKRLKDRKFAPLQHAFGIYFMARNNLTSARDRFEATIAIDPGFTEAHLNLGLLKLGFRKYDEAKGHFEKVLSLTGDKSYDAMIGLGIAQRGLGDLDGAEGTYNKALKLDGKRGEALFNLGVLYQDFRAPSLAPEKGIASYETAKEYFKSFLKVSGIKSADKEEAEENIKACDANIKANRDAIKNAEQAEKDRQAAEKAEAEWKAQQEKEEREAKEKEEKEKKGGGK